MTGMLILNMSSMKTGNGYNCKNLMDKEETTIFYN